MLVEVDGTTAGCPGCGISPHAVRIAAAARPGEGNRERSQFKPVRRWAGPALGDKNPAALFIFRSAPGKSLRRGAWPGEPRG